MPSPEITALAIYKAIGALFGTIISFAFLPAMTKQAVFIRTAVSFPCGYIFAEPVRELLKLDDLRDNLLASASIAGLFCWVLFGMVIRLAASATWSNLKWPFKNK